MKETFGQRFSRLRKAKGMTQEVIAEKMNISPQAVSKWENDLSAPDVSLLLPLAELLGVTTDTLLGKEDPGPTRILAEKKDIDKMVLRILVNDGGDKTFDGWYVNGVKVSTLNRMEYVGIADTDMEITARWN